MSSAIAEAPNVLVRLKYYPFAGGGSYSNRRNLYASGIADDYMSYVDKGITATNDSGMDYIKYVGNDEKSEGVFGKDGLLTKPQKAEIRKQLLKTESVIWDMIISFKEGYGDRYMRDSATAQALLKAQLNKFFRSTGLNPDNMIWFSGLHTNTDNRHLHVCFFEKEPIFLRRGQDGKHFHHGKLRRSGIDGFKLSIEQYFSDTTMQLKADRAEVIAAAKDSLNHNKHLKNKVSALADLLLDTGKLGYDSENMRNLRETVDGITTNILHNYPSARKAYLIPTTVRGILTVSITRRFCSATIPMPRRYA